MRVLLVEDEPGFAEGVLAEPAFKEFGVVFVVAESLESARELLEHEDFDLVVSDLELPSTDGAGDRTIDCGKNACVASVELLPGTPVVVLSGRGSLSDAIELFRLPLSSGDMYGNGVDWKMLDYVEKRRLDEFVDRVLAQAVALGELQQVEIATGIHVLELSESQRRIIQTYVRRTGGQVAHVESLDEGLSDARVLKVTSMGANREYRARAVGRIASMADIRDEAERYNSHIVSRLPFGSYVPLDFAVGVGAGRLGGHFYSLADGYDESLFSVLADDPASAAQLVEKTAKPLGKWSEGAQAQSVTVGEIVELLSGGPGDDGDAELRRSSFAARLCSAHGDLHGANILVRDRTEIVVIDFARATKAPSALDPVTLELSPLFHPSMEEFRDDIQCDAESWYQDVSAVPDAMAPYVMACREWAFEVAAGDREVYACAYAYATRQLKYSDTNKDWANGIAKSAARMLSS